jgi:hypothetical protein
MKVALFIYHASDDRAGRVQKVHVQVGRLFLGVLVQFSEGVDGYYPFSIFDADAKNERARSYVGQTTIQIYPVLRIQGGRDELDVESYGRLK